MRWLEESDTPIDPSWPLWKHNVHVLRSWCLSPSAVMLVLAGAAYSLYLVVHAIRVLFA